MTRQRDRFAPVRGDEQMIACWIVEVEGHGECQMSEAIRSAAGSKNFDERRRERFHALNIDRHAGQCWQLPGRRSQETTVFTVNLYLPEPPTTSRDFKLPRSPMWAKSAP
jgi:hypothetical protein